MTAEVREEFQAIPFVPGDTAARVELHSGLSRYYPKLHGNLVARAGAPRDVGFILVHPSSNFLTHFLLRPMAEAGLPAMALNTRYSGNEAALIMESAALDLGAGVRWMREELGFAKVVVLGFSGGGSLASFYQGQAERPTVTSTPAGDPVDLAGLSLARFTTARSWLSTWSVDDSNAYAPRDLATVKSPVLVMCLNADQAAFPSESAAMAAAVPNGGGELQVLPGLNHYLVGQPGAVDQVVAGFADWALRTGLLAG